MHVFSGEILKVTKNLSALRNASRWKNYYVNAWFRVFLRKQFDLKNPKVEFGHNTDACQKRDPYSLLECSLKLLKEYYLEVCEIPSSDDLVIWLKLQCHLL